MGGLLPLMEEEEDEEEELSSSDGWDKWQYGWLTGGRWRDGDAACEPTCVSVWVSEEEA